MEVSTTQQGPHTPRLAETHEAQSVNETNSPYDRVCEYIKRFKDWEFGINATPEDYEIFERRFSIQISLVDWIRLEDLNTSEKKLSKPLARSRCVANTPRLRYPRFSYNALTSTLVIQAMAGPLHESMVSFFAQGFHTMHSSLPLPVRQRVAVFTNLKSVGFEGQYCASSKAPDLMVRFREPGEHYGPMVILEVGFSETYEELVRDAKMWLDGNHNVKTCILVKFNESPAHRNPTRSLNPQQRKLLDTKTFQRVDFQATGEYGPVVHKGLVWVGSVSVYMELWGRDPETGLAAKVGDRINLHEPDSPPKVEFQLSDYLGIAPENDRRVVFDWERYLLDLKEEMIDMAIWRYQSAWPDSKLASDLPSQF